MAIVYYGVTPSNCAESGDCGGNQPCTPQPGQCVYYSGTYLSGPNIQEGDNFNTVTLKLSNYIASIISGAGTVTDAANLGFGLGSFINKTGDTLNFKSLTAGPNIILTPTAYEIQISSTGIGTSETAINLGGEIEIFKIKAGDEFQFRTVLGNELVKVSQIGDTVEVKYDNKDKYSLASDSVRIYPPGTYIEKIVIKPQATISAFKIGTSPGNDDVVTEQPIAGSVHTTLVVEKYFEAGVTLYIQGINSTTSFLTFLEYSI